MTDTETDRSTAESRAAERGATGEGSDSRPSSVAKNTFGKLRSELQSYAAIRKRIADEYGEIDPIALADTLEGETNLHEVLAEIVLEALAMEEMARAVKRREEALAERRRRIEKTAESLLTTVLQAMEQSGVKSIKQPAVTITRRPTTQVPVLEDESLIPSAYWKPQPPKLDKKALLAALRLEDVPGARLSNGGETLNVRRL